MSRQLGGQSRQVSETIAEWCENPGGAPAAPNVGLHNRKLDLRLSFVESWDAEESSDDIRFDSALVGTWIEFDAIAQVIYTYINGTGTLTNISVP